MRAHTHRYRQSHRYTQSGAIRGTIEQPHLANDHRLTGSVRTAKAETETLKKQSANGDVDADVDADADADADAVAKQLQFIGSCN